MNAAKKRTMLLGGGALAVIGLLWYASNGTPQEDGQQIGGTIGGGGGPTVTTPGGGTNYSLAFPDIALPAMPTMPTYTLMNPMDYLAGYASTTESYDWTYAEAMSKKAENVAQYEALYGPIASAGGDDAPTYADVNRAARKANNAATGATTKKDDRLTRESQNRAVESGAWH